MDTESNSVTIDGRKLCNREEFFVEVRHNLDFVKMQELLDS